MSRFFIHSKTLSYPTRLHKSTGSPESSLITFVINTSRYGFIMLGSRDSKKKKTLVHIYDTERPERLNDHRHVGHCVHARVVMYMYLTFVMTWQNISTICISPTFIEPSVRLSLNKNLACINAGCTRISDTDDRTDRRNAPVPLICSLTDVLDEKRKHRRQTHYLTKINEKNVVYELLKITSRKKDHCTN